VLLDIHAIMHPCLADGQFFGKTLRREAIAGLVLTETGYAPRTTIPRHSHSNPYICLVCAGGYTEIYGRRTRECEPHTVVFHPPGEVHTERFHDAPGRSFNIELPAPWTKRVGLLSSVLDRPLDFRGGQFASLTARLYDEFQRCDAVTPLAVEGLTLELLARAARTLERPAGERRPPAWLDQVRDLLHARFAEDLSLGEIASTAGVHPAYLSASFRRHYQCTVGDYLRQRRVESARRLLADTGLPLPEVARVTGFADHSHFARTFKNLTGTTPSRYRRSARAAGSG
jgi:AraC family transcriptional regulator